MGDNYKWGDNPVQDFLFQLLLLGNDLTHSELEDGITENIAMILTYMGIKPGEITQYLEYKIKKDKGIHFRVMPNNIVSAMWFTGIVPENSETVFLNNSAVYKGNKFKFNKKTKRLTWAKLKE